jgi:hypothetical protein
MPTPINQSRLNSEDPGESYKNLTATTYSNIISAANTLTQNNAAATNITKSETRHFEELRNRYQDAFHAILVDDQNTSLTLEDQPSYKGAIDPTNLAKPPLNKIPKIPSSDDPNSPEQHQYLKARNDAINETLRQYQNNFEATLQKLKDQQARELREFTEQGKGYVARLKSANTNLKVEEFAEKQNNEFLAYQQQQLNHLKALYEERQQNFLNRVQNVDRDLTILQGQGKTEQEARKALIQPSIYGNAINSEIKNTLDQNFTFRSVPLEYFILDSSDPDYTWESRAKLAMLYEKARNAEKGSNFIAKWWHTRNLENFAKEFKQNFGWDPLSNGQYPDERVQFSINIKGSGDQATANIYFDTDDKHIPHGQRLGAWNTALDKLLAKDKNNFNLMWAKLSFPENPESKRYEALLDMARHIWAQNPNAKITPGFLPGKMPNGKHTGYYKAFIDMQNDALSGKFQRQSRARHGFPTSSPSITTMPFNVPQLKSPGTTFEGVNGLTEEQNRSLAFGAGTRSPVNSAAAAAASGTPSSIRSGGSTHVEPDPALPSVKIKSR